MTAADFPDPTGWWCIEAGELMRALRRAASGDDPGVVYAELFANSGGAGEQTDAGVPLAHRTDGTGHWMLFDGQGRIVGCHCGFVTSVDEYTHGDDFLDHFEAVVRAECAS